MTLGKFTCKLGANDAEPAQALLSNLQELLQAAEPFPRLSGVYCLSLFMLECATCVEVRGQL